MKRIWLISCILVLSVAVQAREEEPAVLQNPFSGFETLFLSNGLKVWYKDMPEDPNVFIGVSVPVGRDHDPVGKEELAHFTEHMLFSDHMGRTEEEIKREVEDLRGVRNATYGCNGVMAAAAGGSVRSQQALEHFTVTAQCHQL